MTLEEALEVMEIVDDLQREEPALDNDGLWKFLGELPEWKEFVESGLLDDIGRVTPTGYAQSADKQCSAAVLSSTLVPAVSKWVMGFTMAALPGASQYVNLVLGEISKVWLAKANEPGFNSQIEVPGVEGSVERVDIKAGDILRVVRWDNKISLRRKREGTWTVLIEEDITSEPQEFHVGMLIFPGFEELSGTTTRLTDFYVWWDGLGELIRDAVGLDSPRSAFNSGRIRV